MELRDKTCRHVTLKNTVFIILRTLDLLTYLEPPMEKGEEISKRSRSSNDYVWGAEHSKPLEFKSANILFLEFRQTYDSVMLL